jgi:uncharacterized membrane protein
MKTLLVLGVFLFCGLASVVYADTVPEEVTRIDYEKCVGDDKSPEKIQYCNCIRNATGQWSMEEYGEVAAEAEQTQKAPQKLVDMARTCLAQIHH